MRMLRELLIVVVAMAIIGLADKAWGAECYHSAAAVRADHAGAWPSWTLRSPGHAGEKCWIAAERARQGNREIHGRSASRSGPRLALLPAEANEFTAERQVMSAGRPSVGRIHDTPRPWSSSAAGVVPIPRAMPFELIKERELERLIPFNERWADLYLSWR